MGTVRAWLALHWSRGCTPQCRAVLLAEPLHGHNTEASSVPGHPVTLHTHPTEHSQDPAAPLTQPSSVPRDLVAPLPLPAVSLGTPRPSPPPALAPQPCPLRAVPGAKLWAFLQHHVLPLTQCQLLAPHSSPCTAGASASSSGQAWQAGRRRRRFPKQLKETEPPLSHARQVPDRS